MKMTAKEVAGLRAALFGDSTSKKEKAVTSKAPEVASAGSLPVHPPPPPPSSVEEGEEVKSKPTAGDEVQVPTEGAEGGGDNEFGGMLT